MSPDPVFVLGLPRSFTSLFCAMLGEHSGLYGVPELNLMMASTVVEFWSGRSSDGKSNKTSFWRSVMRDGCLRTIAELYSGEQTIASINMAYRWLKVRNQQTTAEVYCELCQKIAPKRIVDKSPGYVSQPEYLKRIDEAFPQAHYIHLLRHPHHQGNSLLRAKGGIAMLVMLGSIDRSAPDPVIDPQILWHDGQTRILQFLRTIPQERVLRIRGEDILADPSHEMPKVAEWLGLITTEADRERMCHPENSPYAFVGPVNARLGNDINFLKYPKLKPQVSPRQSLPNLTVPLSWRSDGKALYPQVIELARQMGY